MENSKSESVDRRTRKTISLIKKTFTHLLLEKDIKDISISELTELADINRGTFYLHYKDIFDLFEQIEKDVWDDFIGIIEANKNKSQQSLSLILLELFRYIAANPDIFFVIFNTRETTFLNRLIEIVRPKSPAEWENLLSTEKEEYYDYYYHFISFGCVALVNKWVDNGMKETPEYMAELAKQIVANCKYSMQ